ncbi:hypothetical protein ACFY13_16820 [Streptomyces mirabilis]|uniref:hypothetical protein n=1 Tax=Streptomyces mirabilis TaxID=68239 RepID=UPI0036D13D4C
MEDERDFDRVIGKIPKRDKDGHDITGDTLSTGGKRRGDGTLSGMAYDLKILDDDDDTATENDSVRHRQNKDESGELNRLIAEFILDVGFEVLLAAGPPFIRWLREKAFPGVKRWVRKENVVASTTDEGHAQATATELITASRPAPAGCSKAIDVALEDHRTNMSSEEAQTHLAEMLAAAAFIAGKMRLLSNSRIEEDPDFPGLKSAMEKLTTQQVTDSVNRMLEANPSLLEEEASAEFMRIFGGGRVVDGNFVPLRNERVKDALRLTNSEMPPM